MFRYKNFKPHMFTTQNEKSDKFYRKW